MGSLSDESKEPLVLRCFGPLKPIGRAVSGTSFFLIAEES
jgi:hypothetical protein